MPSDAGADYRLRDDETTDPESTALPSAAGREHRLIPDDDSRHFVIKLYIAGRVARSVLAMVNLKKICETHLAGRYRIETIDIREHPDVAQRDQIIAVPTLVIERPAGGTRIVGDLSNTKRVLAVLVSLDT